MSKKILVGTHKGLFRIEKKSTGSWALTENWFLGDAVSMVLSLNQGEQLLAAQDLGHFGVKLKRSDDAGVNWTEATVPAYPEKPEGFEDKDPMRGTDIPWDTRLIWSMASAADGKLWCGTLPGGLFVSDDGGESWELNRPLWDDPRRQKWMGGGYDLAGIHSILIDPRNPNNVTVGVSVGGVWKTEDGGESWEAYGKGLRNEYMPEELAEDPVSQDPHLIVSCPSNFDRFWMQHHNGIFRSDDAGHSWTELENVKPSHFGFTVAVHPKNADRAWFIPAVKDEQRIPVDAHLIVNRTSDGGQSFEALDTGLPQEPTYDLIYRHCLDISPDGEVLAFGSTTGSLWVSEDQGESWTTVSRHLPPIKCVKFEA